MSREQILQTFGRLRREVAEKENEYNRFVNEHWDIIKDHC